MFHKGAPFVSIYALAGFLFLTVLCAPAAALTLPGTVVFERLPVAGAVVFAYRDAASNFSGSGAAVSNPTEEDGVFSLELEPGRYFLVAKKGGSLEGEPGPGEYFGYFGRNPILVGEDRRLDEINIQLVQRRPVELLKTWQSRGRIEGTVTGPSGPVEGAALFLYTDGAGAFRGPAPYMLSGPKATDSEGRFSADVTPATYYIVAVRRQSGALSGPLREGDLHGYFDGNPVKVGAGSVVAVEVQAVEKLRPTAYLLRDRAGVSGVKGKVRNPEGGIPPEMYVFAAPEITMMLGRMPPYRSDPLGKDGSFFIDLPPGRYYLAARSGHGGPPLPGEWYGVYGGERPIPVTVSESVTGGIDITVVRVNVTPAIPEAP